MPPNDSLILKLSVAKNLIDQDLAKEVYQQCQTEKRSAIEILMERGILTPHIAENLAKEAERAQGPKTIGGFRIVSKLGQGGMGAVYKAVQISMQREVALKVIAPEFARDKATCERFVREARSAGRVNHPNVITCYDAGQDGSILFMAMELVLGGDADQLAKAQGGRLPERRALEIVRDAARGLHAVHQAGLLHRDIKPANIFLAQTGEAKLADLGLARTQQGDDKMTMTGSAVGTPAFMSPEQADGAADIDIRSDIYSLGATLFALTVGHAPYQGSSPWVVVAAVLKDPFPDPRSDAPDLGEATAAIILKACSKDRAQRYQEPQTLVADLEQALLGAPTAAGSPPASPASASTGGRPRPRSQPSGATRPGRRPARPSSPGGSVADAPPPAPARPVRRILAVGGMLAVIAIAALALALMGRSAPDPARADGAKPVAGPAPASRPQGPAAPARQESGAAPAPMASATGNAPAVRFWTHRLQNRGPTTSSSAIHFEILPFRSGMPMAGMDVFPSLPTLPQDLAGMMVMRFQHPWSQDRTIYVVEGSPGTRVVALLPFSNLDPVPVLVEQGWKELPRFSSYFPMEFSFTEDRRRASAMGPLRLSSRHLEYRPELAGTPDPTILRLASSPAPPFQPALNLIIRNAQELECASSVLKWPASAIRAMQVTLGDGKPPGAGSPGRASVFATMNPPYVQNGQPPLPSWCGEEGWALLNPPNITMYSGAPPTNDLRGNVLRGMLAVETDGMVRISLDQRFPGFTTGTSVEPDGIRAGFAAIADQHLRDSGWQKTEAHSLPIYERYCRAGELLVVPVSQWWGKAAIAAGKAQAGAGRTVRSCPIRVPWGTRCIDFTMPAPPRTIEYRYRGGLWSLDSRQQWHSPDAPEAPPQVRAAVWAFRDSAWTRIATLRAGTATAPQQVVIPDGFIHPSIRVDSDTVTDTAFGEAWYEVRVLDHQGDYAFEEVLKKHALPANIDWPTLCRSIAANSDLLQDNDTARFTATSGRVAFKTPVPAEASLSLSLLPERGMNKPGLLVSGANADGTPSFQLRVEESGHLSLNILRGDWIRVRSQAPLAADHWNLITAAWGPKGAAIIIDGAASAVTVNAAPEAGIDGRFGLGAICAPTTDQTVINAQIRFHGLGMVPPAPVAPPPPATVPTAAPPVTMPPANAATTGAAATKAAVSGIRIQRMFTRSFPYMNRTLEIASLREGAPLFGNEPLPCWEKPTAAQARLRFIRCDAMHPFGYANEQAQTARPWVISGTPGEQVTVFVPSVATGTTQDLVARGWKPSGRNGQCISYIWTFTAPGEMVFVSSRLVVAAEHPVFDGDSDEAVAEQARFQAFYLKIPPSAPLPAAVLASHMPRSAKDWTVLIDGVNRPFGDIAGFQRLAPGMLPARGAKSELFNGANALFPAQITCAAEAITDAPPNALDGLVPPTNPSWRKTLSWMRLTTRMDFRLRNSSEAILENHYTSLPTAKERPIIWQPLLVESDHDVLVSADPAFPDSAKPVYAPLTSPCLDYLAASGWNAHTFKGLDVFRRRCMKGEFLLLPTPSRARYVIAAEVLPAKGLIAVSARSAWGRQIAPGGPFGAVPKTVTIRFRGGQWAVDGTKAWHSPDLPGTPESHRAALFGYNADAAQWTRIGILPANTRDTPATVRIPDGIHQVFLRVNEADGGSDRSAGDAYFEVKY